MPTPEEIANAERLVLVCMGVDAREVARGSARSTCADCGTGVWVSPSGIKLLRSYPRMVPLCPRCAQPVVEAEGGIPIPPNDEQISEMIDYVFSHPDDGQAVLTLLRMVDMRDMDPDKFGKHLKDRMREQAQKQKP